MPKIDGAELRFVLPEIVIIGTLLLTLFSDLLSSRSKSKNIAFPVSIAFLGIAGALTTVIVGWNQESAGVIMRSLLVDPISQFLKAVVLICGLGTVPVMAASKEIDARDRGEVSALILLVVFAVMILASAQNLVVTFLALQIAIMACSILVSFRQKPRSSSEAGLKYFLHAEMVSLVFLFGIVLLFFKTSSVYIPEIRQALATQGDTHALSIVSFSFLLLGILVLGWAFPFQMLAPDVSQGSPVALSCFVLAAPLIGSVALILRFCVQLFGKNTTQGWETLQSVQWDIAFAWLSAFTMTVGTFGSVFQTNIKRFLGYTTVGQIGYLLLGLASLDYGALAAVLSGLVSFCVASLGIFAVVHRVVSSTGSEEISAFKGLVWRNAFAGVLACIFLLSLSGLPPFAGFASRFELMSAVVRGKLYGLSIVVLLNWVVGIVAYGKLIKEIFYPVKEADALETNVGTAKLVNGVLMAMLAPTLILGIAWNPLHSLLIRSIEKITW